MALMLRLEGIPSRVVAGFLKGEWNEPAQEFLIRDRDAHAWVEAYIPRVGWIPFDPSPRQTGGSGIKISWSRTAAEYWDYLDLKWNQFVIQYDLYAQLRAFENIRSSSDQFGVKLFQWWFHHRPHASQSPAGRQASGAEKGFRDFQQFKWLLLWGLLIAGVSWWSFARRDPFDVSTTVGQYGQFLRRMARAGCPKNFYETGWEFAERVSARWPDQETTVREVTEKYYRARFCKSTREIS
jgi:hypothetical protein